MWREEAQTVDSRLEKKGSGEQGSTLAARLGSSAANHGRSSDFQASLHPDHTLLPHHDWLQAADARRLRAKVSTQESTTARACRSLAATHQMAPRLCLPALHLQALARFTLFMF